MILLRARKTNVPAAFLNMALKDENSPMREIRTKNVITGIWSCPAFAMYLSNKCELILSWGQPRRQHSVNLSSGR